MGHRRGLRRHGLHAHLASAHRVFVRTAARGSGPQPGFWRGVFCARRGQPCAFRLAPPRRSALIPAFPAVGALRPFCFLPCLRLWPSLPFALPFPLLIPALSPVWHLPRPISCALRPSAAAFSGQILFHSARAELLQNSGRLWHSKQIESADRRSRARRRACVLAAPAVSPFEGFRELRPKSSGCAAIPAQRPAPDRHPAGQSLRPPFSARAGACGRRRLPSRRPQQRRCYRNPLRRRAPRAWTRPKPF